MGLRERKIEARRERLIDAAIELFAEHGLDDTSVEAIAARATLSPRTFYRYFADKADVLATAGRELIDEGLSDLPQSPTLRDIVVTVGRTMEGAASRERPRQLLSLLQQRPEMIGPARNEWRDSTELIAMRVAAAHGAEEPGYDHRVLAATAFGLILVAAEELVVRRPNATYEDLLDEAVSSLCETASS